MKSNPVDIPKITLPKGGGAVRSIDEKFSVNAINGTSQFNIPLPLSPGRNNFTPGLALSYDSGKGNSAFGLGWGVEYPRIQRKTEKKLPTYQDALESDVFVFGGEDLVAELIAEKDPSGSTVWKKSTKKSGTKTITRYRPRIEGLFSRIEKIDDGGNTYWQVRSKENVVSIFGESDEAKIFNPVASAKNQIFTWCLQYVYDDKGNFASYNYVKENLDNVADEVCEKNRKNHLAPFANNYLKSVKYGNAKAFYEGDAHPTDFYFELIFDFGEHDPLQPTTQLVKNWSARKDPYSEYRSGFEIRTYRLCRRILMFHHFPDELQRKDYLVKSLDLTYDEVPHLTYLEKATITGYIWNNNGTLKSSRSFPPLEFSYVKREFNRDVQEVPQESIVHDPIGLDSPLYEWSDLYSEGIAGILTEQAHGWYYKENLGAGEFSPAKLISPKPSFHGLAEGAVTIQELEGNGIKYLVSAERAAKGYFEITSDDEWKSFQPFETYPNLDLRDPNLKFIDLDGDGLPDLLLSKEQDFVWYKSRGTAGYDDPLMAARAEDEEKGPRIVFADKSEHLLIATADMSGDGLRDIVFISHANVCYYPNMGFGKFGARVTLGMTGQFDKPAAFNTRFLHLADIDGSGTTDIIYVGKEKTQVWFNQSGNSLSEPSEIFNPFPRLDNQVTLSFVDLKGNGTACMVWSSPLPQDAYAPMRYIDIMGGRKPHLMNFHKNNRGSEVTVEYTSSTQYYLNDKKAGKKWITKLPFPVSCVSKIIANDKVSQTRFTNEYSYHHGYYDPYEREFRGFALIVQKDSETIDHYVKQTIGSSTQTVEKDLFQPAVITKSWYHTGAFLNRYRQLNQLQQEYYPDALINSGQITDPKVISTLIKYSLTDVPASDGLTSQEVAECFRSLKGLPLRQEVYSDEGDQKVRIHPYSVRQFNYTVQMLQPTENQRHAVFLPLEQENLAIHFERNPLDPRVVHSLNIEVDHFGNILEAAAIVYGRVEEDLALPTQADRDKQSQQHVTYARNQYTKLIDLPNAYHLPVTCEQESWELSVTSPTSSLFSLTGIQTLFAAAIEKPYEKVCAVNEKRKLQHSRALFLTSDLKGPAPLGTLSLPLLPFENYLLAFTPSLVADLYGTKTDDGFLRSQGKYVTSGGDTNYWIRSGRTLYHPDLTTNPFIKIIPAPTPADVAFAKTHFYLPVANEDNFGFLGKVLYDKYDLLIQRAIDAKDNETNVLQFNYRSLAPILVKDVNDNRAGVRFDDLNVVTQTFIMGKEGEFRGDLMDTDSIEFSTKDQPTTKVRYEFRYFVSGGSLPDFVKSSVREQHHFKPKAPDNGNVGSWLATLTGALETTNPGTQASVTWQDSYSYSNGSGQEVLKKMQAEPGKAPARNAAGALIFKSNGKLADPVDTSPALRWIGNGRTILNNKGNPVKQYEPYFDSTFEYNTEKELVEIGFPSVTFYDAPGRAVRMEHPIGTYSKVEFNAWMQKTWDVNDTILDSRWYKDRILSPLPGIAMTEEIKAAKNTAIHAETPSIAYFDSLGRTFLTVAHNKSQRTGEALEESFYHTRTEYDIEGNARSLTDAKGHVVMTWKHNMLGQVCYQHSMDAGDRWMLANVVRNPVRLWNSRQCIFTYQYDELHRPLLYMCDNGTQETCYEKFEYGEMASNAKALNIRGKLHHHYDTAGVVTATAIDFKGNTRRTTRRLVKDYKTQPDWMVSPSLESETFAYETIFDALNRPIQITPPDGSIIVPTYNEANLMEQLAINLKNSATATPFITNINYNEKGQRELIRYGNNTNTRYTYQPENHRLVRMLTTANSGSRVLQDLTCTYDPAGNITSQFDDAQKTIFFGGQKVAARSNYLYDSLYQLTEAEGREHTGQVGNNIQDNWNDSWCKVNLQPNSPIQLRNYTQKYSYDAAGNISKMQHIALGAAGWTRTYHYANPNNQLTKTIVGSNNYVYAYNEHGSIKEIPHLLMPMEWNINEQLQHLNLQGGGDVWYVYDANGNRIRKVIQHLGGKSEERIYIGVFEVYRERMGNITSLERETLHVMDGQQRIALVDTEIGQTSLMRYQYSNHVGSVGLELDHQAKVITYEEYHPFGTTAYQATDSSREVPRKRYRYTRMERDDESGFNYHGARYLVPWLGRWASSDPIGPDGGINLYSYVLNNPVKSIDPTGTEDAPPEKKELTLREKARLGWNMVEFTFLMITGKTPEQHVEPVTKPVKTVYNMSAKAGEKLADKASGIQKPDEYYTTKEESQEQLEAIMDISLFLAPEIPKIKIGLPGPPLVLAEAKGAVVSGEVVLTTPPIKTAPILMAASKSSSKKPDPPIEKPGPAKESPIRPKPSAELTTSLNNPGALTHWANQIKGLGQMEGATVEIAQAKTRSGETIYVAGLNSSARWTDAQLKELQRLGIEVAPQELKGMKNAPHAEENIAAYLQQRGAKGERWSKAVVGREGSYVCSACQAMVKRIGGIIE